MRFEEAWKKKGSHGIGVVFSTEYAPIMLVGVDFDDVEDWKIQQEIANLDLWVEKSVSGKGFHAYIPVLTDEFKDLDHRNKGIKTESFGELEVYSRKRFFAMTFNWVAKATDDSKVWSKEEIEDVFGFSFERKIITIAPDVTSPSGVFYSDEVILSKGVIGDNKDISKNVMRWYASIAPYAQDKAQIIRCFNQTPLAVGKYDPTGENKFARIVEYFLRDLPLEKARLNNQEFVLSEAAEEMANEEEKTIEEAVEEAVEEQKVYRNRYITLTEEVFCCAGNIRKSLFDGRAYFPHKQGELVDLEDSGVVKTIKDEIRVRNKFETDKEKKFKASEVEDALGAYRFSLPEELLLDVQAWDGQDRIKFLSGLVNFADARVSAGMLEYFLKDWLVRSIHKVMTGRGTNRVVVFQGAQGAGKDSFLGMFVWAWSQRYAREISAPSKYDGEKVLFEQVAQVAAGLLRELDKFDPVALKRLVDNDTFNYREPWEKKPVPFKNRVSLMASCNPKNPFTDTTGNRRFLFFQIEGIPDTIAHTTAYPDKPIAIKRQFDDKDEHYRAQILAQGFHLWRENNKRPLPEVKEYESIMLQIMEGVTPEDSSLESMEDFDQIIKEMIAVRDRVGDKRRLFTKTELIGNQDFLNVCKTMGVSVTAILKQAGNTDRRSRESNPNYCKNTTFFHLPGDFTLEQRRLYKQGNSVASSFSDDLEF